MLTILGLVAVSLPASAQFRSIEIEFDGIGCAACVESLPNRIQRMRGVTSARVDAQKQVLRVELADENRVRVEQIRDAIEQDGTKTTAALVKLRGNLAQSDGKWILTPAGVPRDYEVSGTIPAKLEPGSYLVSGRIERLRQDSGRLIIIATEMKAAP